MPIFEANVIVMAGTYLAVITLPNYVNYTRKFTEEPSREEILRSWENEREMWVQQ